MEILIIIIGLIIGISFFVLRMQSLHYPNLDLNEWKKKGIKNVLFIFPHPDDEAMSSGGLIIKTANDSDFNVFVVDVTKGDRGDELLKLPPAELGKVRESEYFKAMKVLGANNAEIWDFPDGFVPDNSEKVKERIEKYIKEKSIQLVITFERWGIYGHQDHVALSNIVYEIGEKNKELKILYSTIGPKIAAAMNLKQYISGLDLAEFESNELPEFKLPILFQLIRQYRAVRNYKSQNLSHKFPLWVTIFMNPYEYYTSKFKPE